MEIVQCKGMTKSLSQPLFKEVNKKRPKTSKPNMNFNRMSQLNNQYRQQRPTTGVPKIFNKSESQKIFAERTQQTQYACSEKVISQFANRPISSVQHRSKFDFRKVLPIPNYSDKMFDEYWKPSVAESVSFINKVKQNRNDEAKKNNTDDEYLSFNIYNKDKKFSIDLTRNLYKFPQIDWSNKKPCSFLTHVGGNLIDLNKCNSKAPTRPDTAFRQQSPLRVRDSRPQTAMPQSSKMVRNKSCTNFRPQTAKAVFQREEALKIIEAMNKQKERPTSSRPISSIPKEVLEQLNEKIENDYKYDNDFFNDEEHKRQVNLNNYPRLKQLYDKFSGIDLKDSIAKAQAVNEEINKDVFDRSQRTKAATVAKIGDFTFYPSFSRIGSFIDYSMHLKWDDLINLEKKLAETKLNADKKRKESREKKVIIKPKKVKKGPINYAEKILHDADTLFHGMMPFETEGYQKNKRVFFREDGESYDVDGYYDPNRFLNLPALEVVFNPTNYPEEFKEDLIASLKNFEKFSSNEKIRDTDILKFNKDKLRTSVLKDLKFILGGVINENELYLRMIERNIEEVEIDYNKTLREIILKYIVRCPYERTRLNILYYPIKVLPSSYTIAQYGSFNRSFYYDWVNNFTRSAKFLEKNLSLCNTSISGIVDWTQNFKHVNLLFLDEIRDLKDPLTKTIHIDDFVNIQKSYMDKCKRFLRDIYYRGVLLILRKNKQLKRKDLGCKNGTVNCESKWTFKGFFPKLPEYKEVFKNSKSGMHFVDKLNDFWSNIKCSDLIDVRLNPSYLTHFTCVQKKQLDLDSNDYDGLSQEKKDQLNKSASTYVTIFLRKLCVNALNEFLAFFEASKEKQKIYNDMKLQEAEEQLKNVGYTEENDEEKGKNKKDSKPEINKEKTDLFYYINYNAKDIQLPNNIIAFKIHHLVNPILSIKVIIDSDFKTVELEYTADEVNKKIKSVIDHLVKLFSDLNTLDFMEFKKIQPAQLEDLVREHASKINEFFSENAKENKSFHEDYFKSLCPYLIVEKLSSKFNRNEKLDISGKLSILKGNEKIVERVESRINLIVKTQYNEVIKDYKDIYDNLEKVYKGTFSEEIDNFLSGKKEEKASEVKTNVKGGNKRPGKKVEDDITNQNKYLPFISEIRRLQKYIVLIPDHVHYSLFSIDNRAAKKQLNDILEENLKKLVDSIEKKIIDNYDENLRSFEYLINLINKKTSTPEEAVVMMENYQKKLDEDKKSTNRTENNIERFDFLLKIGNIFSEELIQKTCEVVSKKAKYNEECKTIEEAYNNELNALNTKILNEREDLKKEITEYLIEIKDLDKETHIAEYDSVIEIISKLGEAMKTLEERITKNRSDVDNLLKAKSGLDFEDNEAPAHPFIKLKDGKRKLEKLGVLWKNIKKFYVERKDLIKNFSEQTNIEAYQEKFDEISIRIAKNKEELTEEEEIVQKMSKILEDDIGNIQIFLGVASEIIDSEPPLSDVLKLRVLNIIESKQIDASCRDILENLYQRKI